MKEIGGYIELDTYDLPMYHEEGIGLNCGRNCLAYLILTKKIKRILLPYLICDSVIDVCVKYGVEINYYSIDEYFCPQNVEKDNEEWLYIVNYYGQLSNEKLQELVLKYKNVVVDQAQAYFQKPMKGVDTIYTCRKFFGVPDGAFLYTDTDITDQLQLDESYCRMNFLLGRYERTASEFYDEYVSNNRLFANEDIKRMSKLTLNLLHAINYEKVKNVRTANYEYLYNAFQKYNLLKLKKIEGAFSFPFMTENAEKIRRNLLKAKIYIPTLWPNVLKDVSTDALEYKMAKYILPIPCDQRYTINDMELIVKNVLEEI